MALSTAEILALNSASSFWEAMEYWSMGAVLLGAIGETVAEFTPVRHSERWRRPMEVLSGLLLIVGLAFEFPATMKTNSISGTLVADAKNQAQQAALLAGKLGVSVGSLNDFVTAQKPRVDAAIKSIKDQSDRLRAVQGQSESRVITTKQRAAIRTLRGKVKVVAYMVESDGDTPLFGAQLDSALTDAGIAVRILLAPPEARWFGVRVCFTDNHSPKQTDLWRVLHANFSVVGECQFPNEAAGVPPDVPLIMVGERPPLFPQGALKTLRFRAHPELSDKAP